MTRLVVGCNYHTTWQSHPAMRFVLVDVSEDGLIAKLQTRKTNKVFTTPTSDLIFIESIHNRNKADRLMEG